MPQHSAATPHSSPYASINRTEQPWEAACRVMEALADHSLRTIDHADGRQFAEASLKSGSA